MTNSNVETDGYPEGATRYSAFEPGHAGDWSNLETPTADSQLHYWAIQRLCFFSSFSFPNARLTLGKNIYSGPFPIFFIRLVFFSC